MVAPEERLGAVYDQWPPRARQRGRAERQADARLRERREQRPMRRAVPAQLVQEVPQVVRAADRHQAPCDRQVALRSKGRLVSAGSPQPGCKSEASTGPCAALCQPRARIKVVQVVHAA